MVDLRVLDSPSALEQVVDLEIVVWGLNARDAVPASLLHASVQNGGLVFGAYEGRRLVGAAYAFPARRGKRMFLWSHMTGVHPDFQGMGIGFSLKQAQRGWALEHGYRHIYWTFDPLQRGNANFNLHRLGAVSTVYHVNYYGEMADAINAGLPSDRLEVRWDLRNRRVHELAQGGSSLPVTDCFPEDQFLLKVGEDGRPILGELGQQSRWQFVEIPFDVRQLKQERREVAYEWRQALRNILQDAFEHGAALVDFVVLESRCWYVLRSDIPWFLYVLECRDTSLYIGITPDVERRVRQHNSGKGAAYTASRRPVRLVAAWRFPGRSEALRAEASLKRHSRRSKLQIVRQHLSYQGGCIVDIG